MRLTPQAPSLKPALLLFIAAALLALPLTGCASSSPYSPEALSGDRADVVQTLAFPGPLQLTTDEARVQTVRVQTPDAGQVEIRVQAGVAMVQVVAGSSADSTVPISTGATTTSQSQDVAPSATAAVSGQGTAAVEPPPGE